MEAALLYAMGLFSDPSMQNEGIPSSGGGGSGYTMLVLPFEHSPLFAPFNLSETGNGIAPDPPGRRARPA